MDGQLDIKQREQSGCPRDQCATSDAGRCWGCRGAQARAHITTQNSVVCAISTGQVVAILAANQAVTLYMPCVQASTRVADRAVISLQL